MTLAAIGFSDPLMLIGLLAGGIPIVLHLLHRSRSPIVPFPTLRFLRVTAMKTSRRRNLQQWMLLFARVALFALIAMAMAKPFIGGGNAGIAYSFIAALLLGAAVIVAAVIMFTSRAVSSAVPAPIHNPQTQGSQSSPPPAASASPAPPASRANPLTALLLAIAGLAILIFASFGLASDRFFSGASGKYSGRATSCVIILDNSHSMLARQESASNWDRARQQARALLTGDAAPAEAAILLTNPNDGPSRESLTPDLTALLGYLENLRVTNRARPMRDLINQAADLLADSSQSQRMLVIISDLARPAVADGELFAPLKAARQHLGNLQVVLMPQTAPRSTLNDVGIDRLALTAGQTVLGSEVTLEAQLINSGDGAAIAELELQCDGAPVPAVTPRVQIGPAGSGQGRATVKIPLRLATAGTHRYTLHIKNAGDALAWDDQRDLILDVAQQRSILVIGPTEQARPRTTAHYVTTALDPFSATASPKPQASQLPAINASQPAPIPWAIAVTYRSVDRAATESLDRYAAVFVCDAPRLPIALTNSLASYVSRGHRLIWFLGPSIDPSTYNSGPGARELLPGPLATPTVTANGSTVDWVDTTAGVFTDLFDNQEPFRNIVVTGRWNFTAPAGVTTAPATPAAPTAPARGKVIARLADGAPLLIEQPAGAGHIYTFMSAPSADWSTMATTVVFLPLINRMALGQTGPTAENAGFETGQSIAIQADTTNPLDVTTPAGSTIDIRPSATPDTSAPRPFIFTAAADPGIYRWQSADAKLRGAFAVNPPGQEADLVPGDIDQLARDSSLARPTVIASAVPQLLAQLDERSQPNSLMPGVIALGVIILILEALLANRRGPAQRSPETHPPREDPALTRAAQHLEALTH